MSEKKKRFIAIEKPDAAQAKFIMSLFREEAGDIEFRQSFAGKEFKTQKDRGSGKKPDFGTIYLVCRTKWVFNRLVKTLKEDASKSLLKKISIGFKFIFLYQPVGNINQKKSFTKLEKEMTAGKKTGKTKRSRNNRKKSEDEMIWFLMVSHINSKQFTILQNDLRDEMEKGSKINWANILLWDGTAHLGGEGFGIDTIDKKIFTKILKIIDKWKKSGKINKTFAKKIKVGLTSRDRHAFDKRTALYDDRNTQFSSKKFIEKQEKELQSRFDKQDAVEQKASKKQGHKRLTNKEVNAKTNTYIRAKDKRGRYLKLVKKFGKTNADRIMTEVRKRGH